jgi:hypothetical protein
MLTLHPPCAAAAAAALLQGLEKHAYNVKMFVDAWVDLWRRVTCLPNFSSDMSNRIFIDVMNEPDSMNIVWEPRDGKPGARELFLATADALWDMTPNQVLFMFEGEAGQHGDSWVSQGGGGHP